LVPETWRCIENEFSGMTKKSIGHFLRLLQASGLGHIGRQMQEVFTDKSSKSGAMRLALA